VGSLDSNERTRLLEEVDSTNVVYSRQHLLFPRETTLMVTADGLVTLELTRRAEALS
jgi:hypothetical protein